MSHDLSHILNHLGEDRELYFNAVSPPIIQTSNFVLPSIDALREAMQDELRHHLYSRGNNPTVEILRKKLAALEHTEDALVFSSGAGAMTSAVVSLIEQGDHVICVRNPYSWTKHLLTQFLPRFGVTATFVDGTSMEAIEQAIRPETKVLFLESPNSMTFELQDLSACAELARRHGIFTCIDNTYSSPLYQNPADFGIDLVLHTGTKYLNGHSDVVAGVICGSHALIRRIFNRVYMVWGPLLGPSDAALMIRGLRTLPLRLSRSDSSARILVERLKNHPAVEGVLYPGDDDFPQAELAKKQMRGAGGLFSILLRERDRRALCSFAESLERFLIAVSWGGHESLVMPMAAFYDMPGKPDPDHPINLVRFYIGLEDPDLLWEDIRKGLDKLYQR